VAIARGGSVTLGPRCARPIGGERTEGPRFGSGGTVATVDVPIRAGGGPYWATSAGSMAAVAAVDADVAVRAFGSGRGIALGSGSGAAWPGAIPGRAWASLARFERDLRDGAIPADLVVAMYDPERWRHTPAREQRDPRRAIGRFVELCSDRGYVSMVTPYPRLVTVPDAAFRAEAGETEEEAYLRSGIVASAAAAQICETQAQRLQDRPEAYRAFVAATAGQARAANPDVVHLSGLSTSPGVVATPSMLFEAFASVRDIVDGHYVSLSKGRRPEVMAAFLRMALEAG
jgi:hypothetical protein